ncbi:predicted protein [Plenodomus lingam JN3]|uniref:Predicted protein n=1 Tax=Leptosphaeria maculans (strain JN3 / isolate v23.1.3 / race Av1-4-5-6-7-8) TaxID=985895 RepID=E5A471_LEPMJ|nr:predicted protein [Plenodomus lingam JN3]CBX98416.1 predicted protein [Plenodomus lingam JN3]
MQRRRHGLQHPWRERVFPCIPVFEQREEGEGFGGEEEELGGVDGVLEELGGETP